MKTAILVFFALLASQQGSAADSPAMKTYLHMKQDSDLYLGEGLADAKDFESSAAKALEAAHSRAKGALAEAIHVRVSSQTSENLQSKDGKASEEIKSSTQSQAEANIDNIKFMEFTDFPDKGQMTVLALVSKEDYRRQLAGKSIPVYRPQFGMAVEVDMLNLSSIDELISRSDYFNSIRPPGTYGNSVRPEDHPGPMLGFGLALTWPFMVLKAGYFQQNIQLWNDFHNSATSSADIYGTDTFAFSLILLEAGYDWTPWQWRVQPYLPLRLKAGFLSMADPQWGDEDHFNALLYGASAGLGLRYWLNGEFSIEVSANQNVAFNFQPPKGDALNTNTDRLLHFTPTDTAPPLDLGGTQLHLGIKWSGF